MTTLDLPTDHYPTPRTPQFYVWYAQELLTNRNLFNEFRERCRVIAAAGCYGHETWETVAVCAMHGHSIGLDFMLAVREVSIHKGRPTRYEPGEPGEPAPDNSRYDRAFDMLDRTLKRGIAAVKSYGPPTTADLGGNNAASLEELTAMRTALGEINLSYGLACARALDRSLGNDAPNAADTYTLTLWCAGILALQNRLIDGEVTEGIRLRVMGSSSGMYRATVDRPTNTGENLLVWSGADLVKEADAIAEGVHAATLSILGQGFPDRKDHEDPDPQVLEDEAKQLEEAEAKIAKTNADAQAQAEREAARRRETTPMRKGSAITDAAIAEVRAVEEKQREEAETARKGRENKPQRIEASPDASKKGIKNG